jgi:hypothetical protein
MNSNHALQNLIDITDSLRKFNCTHWLSSGTLLGFYREGGFISHDHDIDLGAKFEGFDPNAVEDILSKGFTWGGVLGYAKDSMQLIFARHNIKCDIFFHYINKNNEQYCSAFSSFAQNGHWYSVGECRRRDYIHKPFGVKEKQYMGHNFFVPEDELSYIKTAFGSTWQTPISSWCYTSSPPNSRPAPADQAVSQMGIAHAQFEAWKRGELFDNPQLESDIQALKKKFKEVKGLS